MLLQENYVLSNGNPIPKIALGTWQVKGDDVVFAVKTAIKLGYRHIDTAAAYGNEKEVAQGIKESGVSREEIYITTKIPAEIKSYEGAKQSIEDSLRYLDTDYIDLMLIHCPQPWDVFNEPDAYKYYDENIAVWRAMEEAYEAGKLKAIGISNFRIPDMENLLKHVKIRPHANQISIHIGLTPMDWIEYCKKEDMLVMSYAPNATGILANDKRVCAMAEKYGVSVPQLGTLPLPRSKQEAHIKENAALDHFTITDEDMAYLISLVE